MTKLGYTVKFKKTLLASLLGLSLSQTCFALEALTDENLSESTGEGIAFLPENFKMVFQKAEDSVADPKASWGDRTKDTGLIRIIPVGPLTSVAANAGAKKADIFIYGLALSQADLETNSRFNNTADPRDATKSGVNLGTETNPWILNVVTATVPDFAGLSTSNNLSYLQLEAPLALQSQPIRYDTMKLGLWGDLFARNQTVAAPPLNFLTGAPSTLAGLDEKLRFQMIANGLYLDGSKLRVFQTLDGATNTGGMSTSYNKTLGLGLLLRLNTHYLSDSGGNNDDKVLRISTRETTGTTKDLTTPAISGTGAAQFSDKEGLYIYSPNINLVLGSIYQPLIVDTPDGKNLSLEVTRIPNQASVYKNIYTDYSGTDTTYKGSTCNVRYCGSDITSINNIAYQGSNATHSSIAIGKVGFSADNKSLIADRSINATGIVMKGGATGDVNLGSAAIDGLLIQHFKISTTGL
ncbi:hypothetical protein DJ533_06485 [Acinetobacter defluvii]|uniref:Uncharacterized protein n=1 Tax=Acinetobacter defluvii TaxID=1871111 RepID=A0A2S2FBH7_9GAMM|nr:hypothetical protein [Acinetobacter defluvii]AWL28248.1 hypothetical protein DJ533_06485 [Acinetobacter defluvii]